MPLNAQNANSHPGGGEGEIKSTYLFVKIPLLFVFIEKSVTVKSFSICDLVFERVLSHYSETQILQIGN